MKKNIFIKLGIIFCVLFLVSCSASSEISNLEEAKGFILSDISGKTVDLNNILGKEVILLNFWATWCPACNEEIPALKKLFSDYKNKISIFAVSVGESRQKVSSFADKKGINYPVLLDDKNKAAALYSVKGIPTLVVIDLERKIQYYGHNIEEAKETIKKLLK